MGEGWRWNDWPVVEGFWCPNTGPEFSSQYPCSLYLQLQGIQHLLLTSKYTHVHIPTNAHEYNFKKYLLR